MSLWGSRERLDQAEEMAGAKSLGQGRPVEQEQRVHRETGRR